MVSLGERLEILRTRRRAFTEPLNYHPQIFSGRSSRLSGRGDWTLASLASPAPFPLTEEVGRASWLSHGMCCQAGAANLGASQLDSTRQGDFALLPSNFARGIRLSLHQTRHNVPNDRGVRCSIHLHQIGTASLLIFGRGCSIHCTIWHSVPIHPSHARQKAPAKSAPCILMPT